MVQSRGTIESSCLEQEACSVENDCLGFWKPRGGGGGVILDVAAQPWRHPGLGREDNAI